MSKMIYFASQLVSIQMLVFLADASALFYAPLEEDMVAIYDVIGDKRVNPIFWHDSYSVGDRCYCNRNFDRGIGEVIVDDTPLGPGKTVREICKFLGPGPGVWGRPMRPLYNDIQCGHGPPHLPTDDLVQDEITCPGRVEWGIDGCGVVGPQWNFTPEPESRKGILTIIQIWIGDVEEWFFGLCTECVSSFWAFLFGGNRNSD